MMRALVTSTGNPPVTIKFVFLDNLQIRLSGCFKCDTKPRSTHRSAAPRLATPPWRDIVSVSPRRSTSTDDRPQPRH
eukprot:1689788-Pleurochrysis_carterae.AAC.2